MNLETTLESILDLESGEPIPNVDETSLTTAHGVLNEELSFPLNAVYSEPADEENDREFPVKIIRLLSLEEHPEVGRYLGLLCEVQEVGNPNESFTVPLSRIVKTKSDPASQFIETYNEWFWQFR